MIKILIVVLLISITLSSCSSSFDSYLHKCTDFCLAEKNSSAITLREALQEYEKDRTDCQKACLDRYNARELR